MSRKWPKAEEKSLARYVDDFKPWLPLPGVNILDLEQLPDGRKRIVEAIYTALTERNIQYAREKYRPDDRIQEIRGPVEILGKDAEGGEGTCLDLSVFFAGLCLGNDLVPVVVVTEGHAFVLVSVTTGKPDWESFGRRELGIFEDALVLSDHINDLRDLVDSGAYIAIECTGFAASRSLPDSVPEGNGRGENGLLPFERAVEAGREQLMSEEDRMRLRFALDVTVAHYGKGIEPPPAEPETITVQTGTPTVEPTAVAEDFEGTLADKVPEVSMDFASEHGALADPAGSVLERHALPRPVSPRVRRPKGFLGRGREQHRIERAAAEGDVILCYGSPGSGKTALLRAVAWGETNEYADGVVYLDVDEKATVADTLQHLYGFFFSTDDPAKLSAQTIERVLQDIEALVILDDVTFDEHTLEELTNALPQSSFVLASEAADQIEFIERIEIGGLEADDALLLLERKLAHPISERDRVAAREICKALGGHPGLIIEAVNALHERGGPPALAEISNIYQGTADAAAIAVDLLAESLSPLAQRALSALAEAGTAVRAEVLASALGHDVVEELGHLVKSERVHAHSPRYSLPGTLVGGVRSQWEPTDWMGELLSSLADWAASPEATTRKVIEDRAFILRAMEWGIEAERWSDVIRVAKSVDAAFALSALWDVWERSLSMALEAAERLGDASSRAWALHQLGTRAIGLGDEEAAVVQLGAAVELRTRLGERKAARITRHNLRLTMPPSLLALAALAVGFVLAVGMLFIPPDAWASGWIWTLEFEPRSLTFSNLAPRDSETKEIKLFNRSEKTISDVDLTIVDSEEFSLVGASPVGDAFRVEVVAAGPGDVAGLTQPAQETTKCNAEGLGLSVTVASGDGCVIEIELRRTGAEEPSARLVARKGSNAWSAELRMEADPDPTTTTTSTTTTTTSTTTTPPTTTTTTTAPPPSLGRVVVEKQTVPDGDSTIFEFTGDLETTLAGGETAVFEVKPGEYTVTEPIPPGWVLIDVTCNDVDSIGAIESATATFKVEADETVTCTFTNKETEPPTADLSVTFEESPDTVTAGRSFSYVIEVRNRGPNHAGNVTLFSSLPPEMRLVDVTSLPGCTTLPCSLGPMSSGASATVVLEAAVSRAAAEGAVLTTTVSVASEIPDPNTTNNSTAARTRVQAAVRSGIGLIDIDRETIEFGDAPGPVRIRLTNVGGRAVIIEGHSVLDPFSVVGCDDATLGPRESCEIEVRFENPGGAWFGVLEVRHDGEGDRRVLITGGR